MTIDPPVALELDACVDQLAALAGPIGQQVADQVRTGIQHLRDDLEVITRVNDEQHAELLALDIGGALGSPGDQWGRAVGAAGPVGRSTDADGSNHAGF